jgi:hypothetical protein
VGRTDPSDRAERLSGRGRRVPSPRRALPVLAPERWRQLSADRGSSSDPLARPANGLELDAPVVGAAGLGVVGIHRLVGAVALGLDPAGVDALVDQVLGDRLGAALRQVEVVIALALVVGVTGDLDADAGVLGQHGDGLVERLGRRRADLVAVGLERDAVDRTGEGLDLLGAAVVVLVAVVGLGLLRARVLLVEEAILVRIVGIVGIDDAGVATVEVGLVRTASATMVRPACRTAIASPTCATTMSARTVACA